MHFTLHHFGRHIKFGCSTLMTQILILEFKYSPPDLSISLSTFYPTVTTLNASLFYKYLLRPLLYTFIWKILGLQKCQTNRLLTSVKTVHISSAYDITPTIGGFNFKADFLTRERCEWKIRWEPGGSLMSNPISFPSFASSLFHFFPFHLPFFKIILSS